MKIKRLSIRNFKSIREMTLESLENALILVGKNSTGKTAVLDAVRAIGGIYEISRDDFQEDHANITMEAELELSQEDLGLLRQQGKVSKYRKEQTWLQDFGKKLPSYGEGILRFTFIAKYNGEILYSDGRKKNNPYIREVFPKVYYIDTLRKLEQFQEDILSSMEHDLIRQMRGDCCVFDQSKKCSHCFTCIGAFRKKTVDELNAFEVSKLLDYKLYQLSLDDFSRRLNANFRRNGGVEQIVYSLERDMSRLLKVKAEMVPGEHRKEEPKPEELSLLEQDLQQENHWPQGQRKSVEKMAKGMRSVYMLSLLETYAEDENQNPGIVIVEEPEIFLHPQMQNVAGEILYRLSRKNQVMFSTHSPHLLSNFNTRQIRQIVRDEEGYSHVRPHTDISRILNDLGYNAMDLMNVDFVFIVEGKQDKSRLPMLIKKYYSEVVGPDGHLSRIEIIATNSCTNIRTYANLKYINQIYLKDRFLMIRDGDGKDPRKLKRQLCHYYEERSREGDDALPRVQPKNVLILKYYSFENYFLDPKVMVQVGVLRREEQFYEIFLKKWKEYLRKLTSGQHLRRVLGRDLKTVQDVKEHMEEIKIYMRGHNLYDIYYGRYKKQEEEILTRYVETAPRETFQDILDAIDQFIYFENRKA